MNLKTYRMLAIGEVLTPGDEAIGPGDDEKWHPVSDHLLGQEVWSDWRYQGNMKFRRLKNVEFVHV